MIWTRKKILSLSKGYRGKGNNCVTIAFRRVEKALQYAYVQRKLKKRNMRRMWITKINATLKANGFNYSRFIHTLSQSSIKLDRKILSTLAENEPLSFQSILKQVIDEGGLKKRFSAGITYANALNHYIKVAPPEVMSAEEKTLPPVRLIGVRDPNKKLTDKEDYLRLGKIEEDEKWIAERKKLEPTLKEMKKVQKTKGKDYLKDRKPFN